MEQYSSFQIGKMLNVSRQAVNQWIDKGYIRSYRTPGGHRRVRSDDLMVFLKERSIPVPDTLVEQTRGANAAIQNPRIMVVDDESDFLLLMRRAILARMPGANVTIHDNGFDALVAIGQGPPDLLILDLKMPKIDGLEICRRLKANSLTQGLPILILTAYDSPQWRSSLKTLNIDEICTKSQPVPQIIEQVENLVGERLGP